MVLKIFTSSVCIHRLKDSYKKSMALKQRKVTIDSMPKYSTSTVPNSSKFQKIQNGANIASEMPNLAVNGSSQEDRKLIHRSSVICSEGFDKYTFDCHRNDIPVRSMGLELDCEFATGNANDSPIPADEIAISPESFQKPKGSMISRAYDTVTKKEASFTDSPNHNLTKKGILLKRESVVHPKECIENKETYSHHDSIYQQTPKPQPRPASLLIKRESVVHPKRSESVFKTPTINEDFIFHSPAFDQKSSHRGILEKQNPVIHQRLVRQKHSSVSSGLKLGSVPEHDVFTATSLKSSCIKRGSLVHGEVDVQRSVCVNGRFQNPWPTWHSPTITNILKFGLSKDKSNVASKQELDLILPIVKPNFVKHSKPPEDGIRVTWIGHSTVLVQMHGLNILTDPMFSDRASPSQVVGPKRYRDPPCSIHDLPHIDAVVISHSHYDHLDFNTVRVLNARFDTDIRWFVPCGLLQWMHQLGCDNVVELDWWEENCVPEHSDTYFIFTPAQHWSKRTIADENKVLWGSWCIIGPKYRFFFAGDTGYCDVFKQIGRIYGPFDLSAIPIGSYEPRWFMKYSHMNPEEAVKVHIDINCKYSLAIHWGTFCLGNEYYLDPPRKLRDGLDQHDISPEYFFTFKHGETRLITQDVPIVKGKTVL